MRGTCPGSSGAVYVHWREPEEVESQCINSLIQFIKTSNCFNTGKYQDIRYKTNTHKLGMHTVHSKHGWSLIKVQDWAHIKKKWAIWPYHSYDMCVH